MHIHEHQAKEIFRQYNIPVSSGNVAITQAEIESAVTNLDFDDIVVKAQIHAGGRGKGGGIKLTRSKQEAREVAYKMWGMNLVTPQTGDKGQKVQRIYFENATNISQELYLSLILDKSNACISIVASREGGVDIEEIAKNSPEKIITVNVDPTIGIYGFHARKIAFGIGLSGELAKQCVKLIQNLYKLFVAIDAEQVEINPLVITEENKLQVLDAKVNLDDNALYRHHELQEMRDKNEEDPLEIRAGNVGLSYVNMEGNIGCMVNGAGLAMSTMDIIKYYGAEPANFLDVGGGADEEKVTEAFNIILSDKKVKGILVNIFGGIMKCDVIARGIVEAAKNVGINVPLVVRLSGTNFELGKEILNNSGLTIIAADNLSEAAQRIVNSIK